MNAHPLNPVTDDDIQTYRRDGVVCLRGMIDADWVARMRDAIDRVAVDPARYGELGPSNGKMLSVCYLWRNDPDFRSFVFDSPIAEIVGRVIGSDTIRLYHDHLFVKPPLSPSIMPWHCDETAWPVVGEMVPNIWTAFSSVNVENGRIDYVAGWHRHCVERELTFGFKADQASGTCPDFEAERDNPDFPFQFISFDMEPGDCVVFHPHTPHFSKGNGSDTMSRMGHAVRLFGDDVVWRNASYKAGVPGLTDLPEGQHPSGHQFPVLWKRL